jgi:hypothetical protein
MTEIKALKLGDGSVLRHGQIIATTGARSRVAESGPVNPLASAAPKNTPTPELASGMRNRITEHSLAFEGGRHPLQDEPNSKLSQNGKSAPIHDGMWSKTPEHRGVDRGRDHGSEVLRSAVIKK